MSVKGGSNLQLNRRKISVLTSTQNRNLQETRSLKAEGKVTTSKNKILVPKGNIYNLLCEAHTATAHRGRDKTERYIRNYYTGISQDNIKLFVSLCKLCQE